MSGMRSVVGFSILAAIVLLVILIARSLLLLSDLAETTAFYLPVWAAVFLAVFTPVAIIANRAQVRQIRIELIDLFARTFHLKPHNGDNDELVSFEFVRGKYFVDLPKSVRDGDLSQVPRFPFLLHSDWMLLFCAAPYMVFSGFGMFVLFAGIDLIGTGGSVATWLKPSILAVGGNPAADSSNAAWANAYHLNLLTVAGFAFAGSYFFTIRLFLRAVTCFDLTPLTFLRAFSHMIMAVILVVVIYRVTPSIAEVADLINLTGDACPKPENCPTTAAPGPYDPTRGVSYLWFFLAFALGFLPDSALYYVLNKSGLSFKDRYGELERHSRLIPLTVIDGIDHATAFRLEECNIFDVQNLAVYNPIMLHIETPFGIYTTVDWVAQAQLCLEFGPERFVALKRLNIRTVFDLENVVKTGSPALIDAVADLLLQDCKQDKAIRDWVGLAKVAALHLAMGEPDALTPEARRAALEALVAAIIGDLHLMRLRQLWDRIARRLHSDGPGLPQEGKQSVPGVQTDSGVDVQSDAEPAQAITPQSAEPVPANDLPDERT